MTEAPLATENVPTPQRSVFQRGMSLFMLGLGGVAVVVALWRMWSGGGVGDPCADAWSCGRDLYCVDKRCVAPCTFDSDCSEGLVCSALNLVELARQPGEAAVALYCLSPKAAERATEKGVERTELSEAMVLGKKKDEVWAQLVEKAAQGKRNISREQFETAWKQLPVTVQRDRTPQVLVELLWVTLPMSQP